MVMLGPGDLGVKHTESLLSQSVRCTEVMEKESLQFQCSQKHAMVGEARGYYGSPWTREHLGVKDKL